MTPTRIIYNPLPPGRRGRPAKRATQDFYRIWRGLRYNGVISSTNKDLATRIKKEIRRATGALCRVDRAGRNAQVQSYLFPNWIVFVDADKSEDPLVRYIADWVFANPEECRSDYQKEPIPKSRGRDPGQDSTRPE